VSGFAPLIEAVNVEVVVPVAVGMASRFALAALPAVIEAGNIVTPLGRAEAVTVTAAVEFDRVTEKPMLAFPRRGTGIAPGVVIDRETVDTGTTTVNCMF
jgi:hypothetical protein